MAQRASALAQAIGSFDTAGGQTTAAALDLTALVKGNTGSPSTAMLAVGSLVDQMRSFSGADAGNSGVSLTTSVGVGLSATQVPPIGMTDLLKISVHNDFIAVPINKIK